MGTELIHRRSPGWVWRNLRGAVLVMGPDEVALQLEGAAALVWRLLDEPLDRQAIVTAVGPRARGADQEPAVLADAALGELMAVGAIRVGPVDQAVGP